VLLAGGVAANELLRSEMVRKSPVPVRFPPLELCTDNAAMIASNGFYQLQQGAAADWALDVIPGLKLAAAGNH
jgi:N6-L-threonylcarbamoyladenine synthase